MNKVIKYVGICAILMGQCLVYGEEKAKNKPVGKNGENGRMVALSPADQLKEFNLHADFIIELVASEEQGVINPIDLAFDNQGRLWTQTARMYPLDPVANAQWNELLKLMDDPEAQRRNPNFKRILDLYEGKTRGDDKILIIEEPHKASSKVNIWADGLAIPQSILPAKNGAYVAQGSQLFFLEDSDGDNKADKRNVLLDGFGITDTHTMAHTLLRGPGGMVHFSHGALNKGEVTALKTGAKLKVEYCKILKMTSDGSKLSLVNAGLNNIWGFQLRDNGQWFGCEANDMGWSVTPLDEGASFNGIGNQKLRDYQPMFPSLHKFRVGGTGISGLAFSEDLEGGFPEEWRNVAFLANPITSKINCVRIVRNSDGTVTAEHLPDLMQSNDAWFRPVNMEFGPDGCLYIADWCNKIISHNEVSREHPDRDKTHGRIWRIRHKSQKPREIVNFSKLKNEQLPAYLMSPYSWERKSAWQQIGERNATELVPELTKICFDENRQELSRLVALWSLEELAVLNLETLQKLAKTNSENLLREVVRAAVNARLNAAQLFSLIEPLANHKNPQIRAQVIRTIDDSGLSDAKIVNLLVGFCKPENPQNTLGGSYEINFERYLARKALETRQDDLNNYLTSPEAFKQPITHITWAMNALPFAVRENAFLAKWETSSEKTIDKSNFLLICQLLDSPKVVELVKPSFQNPKNAKMICQLALEFRAYLQKEKIKNLLIEPTKQLVAEEPATILTLLFEFGLNHLDKEVGKILGGENVALHLPALQVLGNNLKSNKTIIEAVAINEKSTLDLRVYALQLLLRIDKNQAMEQLKKLLTNGDDSLKKYVISTYSLDKNATGTLIELLKQKVITNDHFTYYTAQSVRNILQKDAVAIELFQHHEKLHKAELAKRQKRIAELTEKLTKSQANLSSGKIMFDAMCLSCHSVAGKGAGFAPPLDGSANRELSALLTAIISPDEAAESSFYMYRIIKKDGTAIEAYRDKITDLGTTLTFMGGAQIFVPKSDISAEMYLPGRSVMPSGLIDAFSDQQIADLVGYIKSLK